MTKTLEEFLTSECLIAPGHKITSAELYKIYSSGPYECYTQRTLTAAVKRLTVRLPVIYGKHRFGKNQSRGFTGLTVRDIESWQRPPYVSAHVASDMTGVPLSDLHDEMIRRNIEIIETTYGRVYRAKDIEQ